MAGITLKDFIINEIVVPLHRSNGQKFYAAVSQVGFKFYDRVSSSGTLEGKPIELNVDQIFELIANQGDKKPFRDRESQKKTKKVSP